MKRLHPGLLFTIERCNTRPSHLFGTIHSDDPSLFTENADAALAAGTADVALFEIIEQPGVDQRMANRIRIPAGEPLLSQRIGAKKLAELKRRLDQLGLPVPLAGLAQIKPWAAAMLLDYPKPSHGGLVLDFHLQAVAKAKNIPIKGLETEEEQLDIFDHLSAKEQKLFLLDSLKHFDEGQEVIRQLTDAYRKKDLSALLALDKAQKADTDYPALEKKIDRELIVERNRHMAERLQLYLEKGNAFVAVGALHLITEDGLLEGLEKRGYLISQ